jgi:hypothetical protein
VLERWSNFISFDLARWRLAITLSPLNIGKLYECPSAEKHKTSAHCRRSGFWTAKHHPNLHANLVSKNNRRLVLLKWLSTWPSLGHQARLRPHL